MMVFKGCFNPEKGCFFRKRTPKTNGKKVLPPRKRKLGPMNPKPGEKKLVGKYKETLPLEKFFK